VLLVPLQASCSAAITRATLLPTSPPCTMYPSEPNPSEIINLLSSRAVSSKRISLLGGAAVENAYPGREGTTTWYGNVSGRCCCRSLSSIGRNSRKLPANHVGQLETWNAEWLHGCRCAVHTWPSVQEQQRDGILLLGEQPHEMYVVDLAIIIAYGGNEVREGIDVFFGLSPDGNQSIVVRRLQEKCLLTSQTARTNILQRFAASRMTNRSADTADCSRTLANRAY